MNSIYSDTEFISSMLEYKMERMYSDEGETVLNALLERILQNQKQADEHLTELLTMFEHLHSLDKILEKLNG